MAKQQQFVLKQDLLMTLVEEPNSAQQEFFTEPRLLLPWDEQGLLPFHEIKMTPSEMLASPFVTGLGTRTDCWSTERREKIAAELVKRLHALAFFNCHEIIVSGEFVEKITQPVGAEGYFRVDGDRFPLAELQDYLSTVTPGLTWQWMSAPSGDCLAQLYPVFCYQRGDEVIEVFPAPLDHFHSSTEGISKGVVRLSQH